MIEKDANCFSTDFFLCNQAKGEFCVPCKICFARMLLESAYIVFIIKSGFGMKGFKMVRIIDPGQRRANLIE
jgi:hypothetical protein